ncbi:DUF3080 domain-containing protein [Photobacterium halotolerans]|uniref:DUF3080 domain-containing protein n=1 Tax=Photobacterium halotolerans TaxID=265726 RepID=UPI000695C646|nr:DUF3080 domain-containing protein [Photobacterium halotolerans]
MHRHFASNLLNTSKLLIRLTICGLLILLVGCDRQSSDNQFANYADRLASVLEVSSPKAPDTRLPSLPEVSDTLQRTEDVRMGLIDAYELRKCGLFHLIAERNSVLGKVQDRTRQLRYELLLLDGLGHCIATLPEDDNVRAQLLQVQATKEDDLPKYLWNMLLTGEEWQKQFKPAHAAFSLSNIPDATETMQAMSGLAHIASQISAQHSVSAQSAERLLSYEENIHTSRYLGQLFYSMVRATDWLNTTTTLLNQNDATVMCGPNRNQQKANFLENVFYKFFVTDIQPYLAKLDARYQDIQPDLQTLFATPRRPAAVADYHSFYVNGDMYRQFRDATLNHVSYWQTLFKRCGIKVGQS